ncbi:MAG: hypothetical protein ACOYJS_01045 [Acutalibacteraceae bacterium]|jgi:hypothetical protein
MLHKAHVEALLFNDVFVFVIQATQLREFSKELSERVGFNVTVIHTTSRDIALAAGHINDSSIYICLGTWRLIRPENKTPVLDFEAAQNEL